MRTFVVAILAAVWSVSAYAADRPNIIYILADDLSYGDLGCYGQATLTTPNLDKMAADGIRFTRHYAGSTVCAPSRCVLLTGLHTGHARIRGNHAVLLREEDITVAEKMKEASYTTGCVGKWGVGHPPPDDDPNRQGFDFFYGYINMYHAHNFFPSWIVKDGKRLPLRNVQRPEWKNSERGEGIAAKKIDYVPHLAHKEALAFIDRNARKPFFLYYALNIPHANNEGGRMYKGKPGQDGMEVPGFAPGMKEEWNLQERGFATMIHFIDGYVGDILAKLKEHGIAENTLVMFSSDNGPHQEGGHNMEFFDSNGKLRGMKRDVYEGGIRVPFIARWPARIKPGRTSGHISGFQDIMPTLCELAGVPLPATDGISMVATFLGDEEKQAAHPYLYWEFEEKGGRQAVLKGDWKGVRLNTIEKPNGPIEIYNVAKDIGEAHNLAATQPELAKEFARLMKEAHRPEE